MICIACRARHCTSERGKVKPSPSRLQVRGPNSGSPTQPFAYAWVVMWHYLKPLGYRGHTLVEGRSGGAIFVGRSVCRSTDNIS